MMYLYDGTFYGYLSAIFIIFEKRDSCATLAQNGENAPVSLTGEITVKKSNEKARRVEKGLCGLSPDLARIINEAWLSREAGIDETLLALIRMAFKKKRDPMTMLYEPIVRRVTDAACKVGRERGRYLEFVRFVRAAEGCYVADIEPAYDILPLISNHFTERFPMNMLIIRDRKRGTAMVWNKKTWHITDDPDIQKPPLPKDSEFENLWRRYFKVLCIPARRNLKLQAHFIPQRYRRYLTEMQRISDTEEDKNGFKYLQPD